MSEKYPDPPLPQKGEVIPVQLIRFATPHDVPGEEAVSNVKAGGGVNQRRWKIDYIPGLRHFRIVYRMPNDPKPPIVGYVHESQVASWIPLAL